MTDAARTAGPTGQLITVRYFAGAAAATGRPEERLPVGPGETVADVATRLAGSHGDDLARILEVASYLLDEVRAEPSDPVAPGATLDVLPPFAGG